MLKKISSIDQQKRRRHHVVLVLVRSIHAILSFCSDTDKTYDPADPTNCSASGNCPPKAAIPVEITSSKLNATIKWKLRRLPRKQNRALPLRLSIYRHELREEETEEDLRDLSIHDWWNVRTLTGSRITSPHSHAVSLTDLSPGRTYVVKLVTRNDYGQVHVQTVNFTTQGESCKNEKKKRKCKWLAQVNSLIYTQVVCSFIRLMCFFRTIIQIGLLPAGENLRTVTAFWGFVYVL